MKFAKLTNCYVRLWEQCSSLSHANPVFGRVLFIDLNFYAADKFCGTLASRKLWEASSSISQGLLHVVQY